MRLPFLKPSTVATSLDRASPKEHYKIALRLSDPFNKHYDLREAIAHFRAAISARPDDFRYRFELGRVCLDTPRLAVVRGASRLQFKLEEAVKLAIAEFQEATKLNPKFVASYLNLAHSYVIIEEKKQALAAYTNYLVATKQKTDKAEDRLQNLEYALLKRRKPDPDKEKAEAHLKQAVQYRENGKYRKAAKELQKAYAVAPDFPWVYKRLYKLGH